MSSERPFHNPFDVLKSLKSMKGSLPERPSPEPSPAKNEMPSGARPVPRAVVRLERAGRGGKDVTVVEHLAIPPSDRIVWLKALKAQLGCGGVVENEALVLQGDHRKRLPALLTARGVKKVTVG